MNFRSAACAAALLLAGCAHKNIDTTDAVKEGVLRDVGKNVNVAAMDVNVLSVSFRGTEADAVVSFAPKGGTAQQGLTMTYTLERKGEEWHIKSRAQSDLQKHAAQGGGAMGGAMGNGAMGAAPDAGAGQQLPAGHPDTGAGGSSGQLPPGHPPLNGSSTK